MTTYNSNFDTIETVKSFDPKLNITSPDLITGEPINMIDAIYTHPELRDSVAATDSEGNAKSRYSILQEYAIATNVTYKKAVAKAFTLSMANDTYAELAKGMKATLDPKSAAAKKAMYTAIDNATMTKTIMTVLLV